MDTYRSVPVAVIGSGFTVPPAEMAEFPPLFENVRPQMPQDQLLSVVREVQRRRNRPTPETLPGLFDDATRFVCTFPELDPYRTVRGEPAIGPLTSLPPTESLPDRPSFFAYLVGNYRAAEPILSFLSKLKIAGSIYIRGAAQRLQENLRGLGLEVYSTPAPLGEVLPRVSAILHHGGLLTAQDALTTGRPQLLLPRYLEQELNAQALARMGVGLVLSGRFTVQAVGHALHQVVADPRFTKQAMSLAQSLHERGLPDPLTRVVQHCLSVLGA